VAIYPAGYHPLRYEDDRWTDPITGCCIPKLLDENIDRRLDLRRRCAASASLRRRTLVACRDSLLFWVNMFVDTFKPLEVGENGILRSAANRDIPMITWPVQDPALLTIQQALNEGGDLAIDKSRNMGASYICIIPMLHDFVFRPQRLYKLLSRKEELVDNPGDPDSLFWKIDYMLGRLPEWMRPKIHTRDMQRENLDSGSVLTGESTNSNAGRGGRRDAILIDEAGAIPTLNEILGATHMGVATRLFNSTPVGPGAYSDMIFSGTCKVVVLPWWDHPEFGKDRYRTKDKHGNLIMSSPWRDHEVATKSAREVAQNIDRDHMAAGATFFDTSLIQQHLSTTAIAPHHVGNLRLVCDSDTAFARLRRGQIPVAWDDNPKAGDWKLWLPLTNGRPPQNRSYTIGGDVAHGLGSGHKASNSVLIVMDDDTGEQVAEYASPNIEPHALATLMLSAGYWFGGKRGCAFVAWERNGPGLTVEKHVRRAEYPRIYRQATVRGRAESQTDALGWYSTPEAKRLLFQEAADAMAAGHLLVRSKACLTEMGTIVFLTDNAIGPGWMIQESPEARATHADRVTAICVANHAKRFSGLSRVVKPRPPAGSVARQLEDEAAEQEQEEW